MNPSHEAHDHLSPEDQRVLDHLVASGYDPQSVEFRNLRLIFFETVFYAIFLFVLNLFIAEL